MSRLHRLVETTDHNRLFLLVERTKGELRLVDWLEAYLNRRISALLAPANKEKRNTATSALDHLSWCRVRSKRIRAMVARYLNGGGEGNVEKRREQHILSASVIFLSFYMSLFLRKMNRIIR